ncbi:putative secreted sugar-binding protein [Streptomyces sp. Tu6071]|nr:putative secreted sugar-binding protein [Streptomyces sp. Tu6071]
MGRVGGGRGARSAEAAGAAGGPVQGYRGITHGSLRSSQAECVVDVLVDLPEAGGESRSRALLVAGPEVVDGRGEGGADLGDRARVARGVRRGVDEGAVGGGRVQAGGLGGALEGRDVLDAVGEFHGGGGVGGEVLDERPGGLLAGGALVDADVGRRDEAAAVVLAAPGQYGEGRGAVAQLLRLFGDEGDAPLAVERHGDAAGLEGVVGRPLVAESRGEGLELVVADLPYELLLPGDELPPLGGGAHRGVAVLHPPDARGVPEGRGGVLLEADQGVEAEGPDRAVRLVGGQLERHPLQFLEGAGRSGVPGPREEVLVEVEAVHVGGGGQGAAAAVEGGGLGEDALEVVGGDAVAPHPGREVLHRLAGGAEGGVDVGDHGVHVAAGGDDLGDLGVLLAAVDGDAHVRVLLLEVVHGRLDDGRLAARVVVPELDGTGGVGGGPRGYGAVGAGGAAGEQQRGGEERGAGAAVPGARARGGRGPRGAGAGQGVAKGRVHRGAFLLNEVLGVAGRAPGRGVRRWGGCAGAGWGQSMSRRRSARTRAWSAAGREPVARARRASRSRVPRAVRAPSRTASPATALSRTSGSQRVCSRRWRVVSSTSRSPPARPTGPPRTTTSGSTTPRTGITLCARRGA